MNEYTKIDTVYVRDIEGTKKLIEGDFRSEAVEFLKDKDWIFSEKVDGCLKSNTKLKLFNGDNITIGEIVKKKLPVEVMGYDGENVVPAKVVAWHMNGQTDEWYHIRFDRRGMGTKGGSHFQVIDCTGNHKFFVNGSYVRADELKVGDKLLLNRDYQNLTYTQEQILTGLMVGDGSIAFDGKCVEFSQKKDHEGYVDWLLKSLGSIAGNKQSTRISGYGSEIVPARTISCAQVENFTSWFSDGNKKVIPKDIELSPISVAIMYMDDGSLQFSEKQLDRCTLSLNDYDERSVDNLIEVFQTQMHIYPVKFESKGWNLRFNFKEAQKLQTIIAPYICDCMQYKLSDEFKNHFAGEISNGATETINKLYESEVLEITKKTEVHERYDITTSTHNYFANGVLVHNCNIGVAWDGHKVAYQGRTERAQIPAHLTNKLISIFGTDEAEEMFEQTFGEKQVVLFGEGYGAKIQKGGGNYISDGCDFILFDVYMPDSDTWLKRDGIEDIAKRFGIKAVPVVMTGTIEQAVEFIKTQPRSLINPLHEMEGVVGKPKVDFYDRSHNRLIVKIKVKDFV